MNTKYCFSYIRFSSKKQELGSSLERQEPIAERVAKQHGWHYMPKWNAKNLGVSAYKGDNQKTLESICEAAKQGKIPQGSVMILEALDRATRLPLDDAQDLIKKILRSGIEIYTDLNKRHLTKASLNDVTSVIVTAVELDAAYQYSDKLANRSKGGFDKLMKQAERGEKVYFGGMMPSFITGVKDGKFTVDKRRVDLIKHIYAEYISGKPANRIATELNAKNTPPLSLVTGKLWAPFTIRTILSNAAYTGDFTYRGKTFVDYLPEVVSKADFKKAEYLISKNTNKRGGSPTGNVNSIFNGLGKCVCGASMVVTTSTRGKHQYHYYLCSAARVHKKCSNKGYLMKIRQLETHFLLNFLQETPLGLIGKHTPKAIDESLTIKAEIAAVDKTMDEAVSLLGTGVAVDKIKAKLAALETQKKQLESDLQAATVKTMANSQYPTALNNIKKLIFRVDKEGGVTFGQTKIDINNIPKGRKLVEYAIGEAMKDNDTRTKIKGILPLIVKEVRCNASKNGYTVINHDGKETEFMQLS